MTDPSPDAAEPAPGIQRVDNDDSDDDDSLMKRVNQEIAAARQASLKQQQQQGNAALAKTKEQEQETSMISDSHDILMVSVDEGSGLTGLNDSGDAEDSYHSALGLIQQEFEQQEETETERETDDALETVSAPGAVTPSENHINNTTSNSSSTSNNNLLTSPLSKERRQRMAQAIRMQRQRAKESNTTNTDSNHSSANNSPLPSDRNSNNINTANANNLTLLKRQQIRETMRDAQVLLQKQQQTEPARVPSASQSDTALPSNSASAISHISAKSFAQAPSTRAKLAEFAKEAKRSKAAKQTQNQNQNQPLSAPSTPRTDSPVDVPPLSPHVQALTSTPTTANGAAALSHASPRNSSSISHSQPKGRRTPSPIFDALQKPSTPQHALTSTANLQKHKNTTPSTPTNTTIQAQPSEDATALSTPRRPMIIPEPPTSQAQSQETKKAAAKDSDTAAGKQAAKDDRPKETSASPSRRSNRIKFRDPFPVIKPPVPPREAHEIIQDHFVEVPHVDVEWIKPKTDLRQLIVAAMGPSLPRRSNACGALKVLLHQSKQNQLAMVRTDTFLVALVYAASQPIPVGLEREIALDARTRAVACIASVCEPKENRAILILYPGLLDCLATVVEEDMGEARALACGACALLAKTLECRSTIVEERRLLELLARVCGGQLVDEVVPVDPIPQVISSPREEEFKEPEFDENPGDGHNRPRTPASVDDKMLNQSIESEDDDSAYDLDPSYDEEDDLHSMSSHSASDAEVDDSLVEGNKADTQGVASKNVQTPAEPTDKVDNAGDNGETTTIAAASIWSMTSSVRTMKRERRHEYLERARVNSCAVFVQLSKHAAISSTLCNNSVVLENMLRVAVEFHNPIHTKCWEVFLNLSKFSHNNAVLVKFDGLVDSIVKAGNCESLSTRIAVLRLFQNLSSDSASKLSLATDHILAFVTNCSMRRNPHEKEAAVTALCNLTTEPGAVVAITNTKNAIATLVHLAHNPESSSNVRMRASEALATVSLWLQTLAGTGRVPKSVDSTALPSHRTTGWERWD